MTHTTLDFIGKYSDVIDGCPFVIDEQQNTNGTHRRPVIYIYMPGAVGQGAADNL